MCSRSASIVSSGGSFGSLISFKEVNRLRGRVYRFSPIALVIGVSLFASAPLHEWRRVSHDPIISPRNGTWESAGTFNPAVAYKDRKIVMLYRAQDGSGTSRLGYAESVDGVHFTRRRQPVFSPETEYEKDGGVEDPRLVKFGDTYYLTYTGYNKNDAQLCLATSKDLLQWERKGIVLPAYQGSWNRGWTKSGAIVPQKIQGKYWMYFLGTNVYKRDETGLAVSTDLLHWTDATRQPVLPNRVGKFDSRVAEPGPPPIITKDGILLIYNGADDKLVYRTGMALFSAHDPGKLIWRREEPLFAPERHWEKSGQVPNVVFMEGMLRKGERYLLYYGGADKYVGVAEADLSR